MSKEKELLEEQAPVKQTQKKIIYRPKTERKYERVHDAYDLCRIIAKHGDKVGICYFDI